MIARCVLKRLMIRAARERDGATAVEFALVAPVFLFPLFAIMEIGLVMFASSTLEDATYDAGRIIRTGTLQASGEGIDVFRTLLCDGLYGFMTCDDLVIDVRSFTSFATVSLPEVFDEDDEVDETALAFAPGAAEAIVVVRVWGDWQAITPGLKYIVGNPSQSTLRLSAATVFRNEPF